MLHSLLLDAAPATQGTPVTVYVTIGAAVVAGLASLNATRVSAKTSREVASLASQTAKESARIAAETAKELKDTDYKNDFYKKLIDKRLNAWAEAEKLMSRLANFTTDTKDGRNIFNYFKDPDEFRLVVDNINNSMVTQVIWIGDPYSTKLLAFRSKLIAIWESCLIKDRYDKNNNILIDSHLLWLAGKAHHEEMTRLYGEAAFTLVMQLSNLHDIEGYIGRTKSVSPAPTTTVITQKSPD